MSPLILPGGSKVVDSGYTSISTNGAVWRSQNISLGVTLDDVARHLLFFHAHGKLQGAVGSGYAAYGGYGYLNSNTTWQFSCKEDATGRSVSIGWDIVRVPGTVQRGVYSWSPGASNGVLNCDITVSAVADYTKCWAWILNQSREILPSDGAGTVANPLDIRGTSSTNLRAKIFRDTADVESYNISWQYYSPT